MARQDKEVWRVVPSLPCVLASSEGRLMVAPYIGPVSRGTGVRSIGGEPTVGAWDGKRYLYQFRGKTYKVHRLVCEAFNGLPPEKAVCMHLDEDARNNAPGNLKWGSQKENLNAPGFIAYCKSRKGENSPLIKGRAKKSAQAILQP